MGDLHSVAQIAKLKIEVSRAWVERADHLAECGEVVFLVQVLVVHGGMVAPALHPGSDVGKPTAQKSATVAFVQSLRLSPAPAARASASVAADGAAGAGQHR